MTNETHKQYTSQLKATVRSCTHRGFVDWSGVRVIAKESAMIIREAETKFEQGNYHEAFSIASAVLDVLVPKLSYIDDSGGYLGENIRAAEVLAAQISAIELPEDLRIEMLKYFILTYDKKRFEGWDWHSMMLKFAIEVARTSKEFAAIQQRINEIPPLNDFDRDFDYQQGQELSAAIILKTKPQEEYIRYLEQNISNTAFRKLLIELAIEAQDFDKAMQLADDGMGNIKSNYISEWENYKLSIYERLNDVPKIIELARKFLIVSYNGEHRRYYDLLKKCVPKSDWSDFIAKVTAELHHSKGINYLSKVYDIWKWEERHDKMLETVMASNSLYFTEEREKDFLPKYSDEVVDCYSVAIVNFVAESRERKRYKAACRYIRKIQKLGYTQRATEVIAELRASHPQRSALLDELDAIC